jgi:type I restriction enzyme S subunit
MAWVEKELGDLITLNYGKSLPEKTRISGKVPVYGSNGLVGYHNSSIVGMPGIVVGRKGSAGEIHYSEQPFCPIDTTFYVTQEDAKCLDLRFCYYALRKLNLKRILGDVGVPGLNREMAYKEILRFPEEIAEQRKIAAILSSVQKAIENQQALIDRTTELKKAIMHKLFTEGTKGEKQKMTEIGLVPESWKVVEICRVISDKMQNGAFIKKPQLGKGLLYVNVVNIYSKPSIDYNKLERINILREKVYQYLLKENDIVFVRSSLKREGIGESCLISNIKESAFYDCHLIKIKPNIEIIIPLFFVYFWRSSKGKKELIKRSKTTTMTTINQDNLAKALMPLPGIEEQNRIANFLENVDQKIDIHSIKKQKLEDLLRVLLHQLMTAEIRVDNIDLNFLKDAA